MGFKADTSFLRYLTMGALGANHVVKELTQLGFHPIELERYATSNKIWATKIKRLRLPDVICVRTGLRVEVRAKSTLEIRMSHAPNNVERHWDAGLRDEDLVAIIVCQDNRGRPAIQGHPSFFTVGALRQSVDNKQLSGLKAASEGSEQHLTWPAIVSKRPGRVQDVDRDRLMVEWSGDGAPTRRYGYTLRGKRPYVKQGESFPSDTVILAGTPSGLADLAPYLAQTYDPLAVLNSTVDVDRFSAAKALPFRPDLHAAARPALEAIVGRDADPRVALEIANGAAALGSAAGADFIHSVIWTSSEAPMRMEAVFITTELGSTIQAQFAADELTSVASNTTRFGGDEARQAAVWGLGHAGLRAYDRLVPYLTDSEENVVLHAIAAFGADTPREVIATLIDGILTGDTDRAAASSEVLRLIGNGDVLEQLVEAATTSHPRRPWIIATLGRLPTDNVRRQLSGTALLNELEPLLLISPGGTWLCDEEASTSLRFLVKQNL